jgi:hypothetical protein
MQTTELDQFLKLLIELAIATRTEPAEGDGDVYWKYLSRDCSLRQVTYAVEDLIKKGGRFPDVGTLRTLALSYRCIPPANIDISQATIPEFSSASDVPFTAEDFFRTVGDLVREKGVKR